MMTQKSLVYVVLAVIVGYLLVSALPQQIAMHTTPFLMTQREYSDIEPVPETSDSLTNPEVLPSENNVLGSSDGREISNLELSRLPDLIKWWTIDVIVALSIYWIAKQRLTQ